tara:strand:+ start:3820 stop:4302 length:483 start_codon:yes stop_codon:yes gene_type:complete
MVMAKKSSKTLAATARRNQIVQLKLYGLNEIQIAENLNITAYRVRTEYKEALAKMNDDTDDAVKVIRDTTHQRYEALLRNLYPKVMKEPIDYNALTNILRIIEGERKLFGLDSEKTEINIDNRQQTFTLDETQDYNQELKRRIANFLENKNNVIESEIKE